MKQKLLNVLSIPIVGILALIYSIGTVCIYLGIAFVWLSRGVAWPIAALGRLLQFLGAHMLPNRGM